MSPRSRWVVEWVKPGGGWQVVARGRSRFRAAAVLLICTLSRPSSDHCVSWYGDA